MQSSVLTMILAGGRGKRLYPLTKHRSKPAVPFGGMYRIIDFTLSNCLNSGLSGIYVLTQYKSFSLEKHISLGWKSLFRSELGEFVHTVPPQQRLADNWYSGTADAIFQNIYLLEEHKPSYVLILSGDHIYKMDYMKLIEFHRKKRAQLTVACVEAPVEQARQFGVMQVDPAMRIRRFAEKPETPEEIPGRPGYALCNMGVYLFRTEFLVRCLVQDARKNTVHDFGKNIIPAVIKDQRVFAYPFVDENRKQRKYWRDIGTLDSYYEAAMDLVSVNPLFNLYDTAWPIRTLVRQAPPAKMVFGSGEYPNVPERVGLSLDSIISPGAIISGGWVERSIVSPNARINSYARVSDAIIMDGVNIGRHAVVRRAIIDKEVNIPEGHAIGVDIERDKKFFTVTENQVVVVPKRSPFLGEIGRT